MQVISKVCREVINVLFTSDIPDRLQSVGHHGDSFLWYLDPLLTASLACSLARLQLNQGLIR